MELFFAFLSAIRRRPSTSFLRHRRRRRGHRPRRVGRNNLVGKFAVGTSLGSTDKRRVSLTGGRGERTERPRREEPVESAQEEILCVRFVCKSYENIKSKYRI